MTKQQTLKTDFDEVEPQEQAETTTVEKAEDGKPYCVKHHCQMKQTSGGKAGSVVAYFKCPVEGCEETGKKVKPSKSVIPHEPHRCPRCKERPILERDAALSKAMYSILKCPACGHKTGPMPRPEFVSHHEQARGVVSAVPIGAR